MEKEGQDCLRKGVGERGRRERGTEEIVSDTLTWEMCRQSRGQPHGSESWLCVHTTFRHHNNTHTHSLQERDASAWFVEDLGQLLCIL